MSDASRRRFFNPRWKKKRKTNSNETNSTAGTPSNDDEISRNLEAGPSTGSLGNEEENAGTEESKSNSGRSSPEEPEPPSGQNPAPKRRIVRKENPYPCWGLYFGEKEYKKSSPLLPKVKAAELFLKKRPNLFELQKSDSIFEIDADLLYNCRVLQEHWPELKSELKNNPELTLNCLGLAVHTFKINKADKDNEEIDVENVNIPIRVKILNHEPILSLKNIKVNYYGKFITVKGCVVRVTKSCVMASMVVVLCNKCNLPYTIKQKNGIYLLKKKCDICGGMKFSPDLSSPYVETIPLQIIRIQEHFGEELEDNARVPRVMDIELFDDLVDSCAPGDDVTLTGIIKKQGTDNGKIKVNPVSTDLYLEANSIVNNNNKNKICGGISLDFSQEDLKSITNIQLQEDILACLVNSLCPSIYGHEIIKMALLLSLFGGTAKQSSLRENIHILIVGDPGLGKSQMLQACSRVAPKGMYVSGNSSTSSGLTVTMIREKGQNDFALEPGALVLADRGCCCIDEFDKMPTQHQALLEAMEQQSVSVAKSGVIWSLPAKTAILAAANPIGGRYQKSKSLANNLNMNAPLLSRFDLIFLLLDQPDKQMDNFLSEHVMLMHTGNEMEENEKAELINRPPSGKPNSLKRRLSKYRNSETNVPANILRKYIAYARQHVKPSLSHESATVLKNYYLRIRRRINSAVDLTPCNRQLEALIRLTEARAKLDLRGETTEDDALDAVELMQSTVLGMIDEKLHCNLEQTIKSSKSSVKTLYNLLKKNSEKVKNHLYPTDELKEIANAGGISAADVLQAIDKLNAEGILIKKANNLYKFQA